MLTTQHPFWESGTLWALKLILWCVGTEKMLGSNEREHKELHSAFTVVQGRLRRQWSVAWTSLHHRETIFRSDLSFYLGSKLKGNRRKTRHCLSFGCEENLVTQQIAMFGSKEMLLAHCSWLPGFEYESFANFLIINEVFCILSLSYNDSHCENKENIRNIEKLFLIKLLSSLITFLFYKKS